MEPIAASIVTETEKRQCIKCPKGHELNHFDPFLEGLKLGMRCDDSKGCPIKEFSPQMIKEKNLMFYGCRECDYDVCAPC